MPPKKLNFATLILFEDDDYVLINKPPFISTLEDRNTQENLLALARASISDAQVCHRLDKDTSGVLAIAKNPVAYRHLSMQFENRKVSKIYHAVADGLHQFQNQCVDAPILKQNDGTVRISREGKEAQTWFASLESFKAHTLIECRPVTGRMHQIRIHLSLLKAPIVGDETYGGKIFFLSSVKRSFKLEKNTKEQPFIKRMALHAFSLEFLNLKGQIINSKAPYPKDFQALLKQLGENKR
ncbi:MAG: RluA family pseudouridine synthase [Bacteroidota bacterium]